MSGTIGWKEYLIGRRAASPGAADWEHLADYWDYCARWWEARTEEMFPIPGLDNYFAERQVKQSLEWADQYKERAEQLRRYMRFAGEVPPGARPAE